MIQVFFAGILALAWACGSAKGAPITALFYTSSPSSWVGHGETALITPADGFRFLASTNLYWVTVVIDNRPQRDLQNLLWWNLNLSTGSGPMRVGDYPNAMRWPFHAQGSPGLDFNGNGRGNNTLTGFFRVLEIELGPDDALLAFAADFVQFDEGIRDWWNIGRIRYNSSIPLEDAPVPEAASAFLTLTGTAALSLRLRLKRLSI